MIVLIDTNIFHYGTDFRYAKNISILYKINYITLTGSLLPNIYEEASA